MKAEKNLFTLLPEAQLAVLKKSFSELGDFNHDFLDKPLPKKATNHFVIPHWDLLAPTYGEAVKRIHKILANRGIIIRDNLTGRSPDDGSTMWFLHAANRTDAAWKKIPELQQNKLMLVPACLTGGYFNVSLDDLYEEMGHSSEFGLDVYAAAIILLSHYPLWLDNDLPLHIGCAGALFPDMSADEYGRANATFYLIESCELSLMTDYDYRSHNGGWATGFILK